MKPINFIQHLRGFYQRIADDKRLNTTHISLYITLFFFWNNKRFPKEFYVNREEIMSFSKIGSKTTYHKCIKELHAWKYITYIPTKNPFRSSKVKMTNIGTSTGPAVSQKWDKQCTDSVPKVGQALVSYININKHNTNISKLKKAQSQEEVACFFKEKKWPAIEAQRFYNHYQSIGWKIGGKTPIEDWQASARNWMLKASEIKKSNQKATQKTTDNLQVNKDKNYNQPL
jgi:hypothetical protein